jgi:hypothetical protein
MTTYSTTAKLKEKVNYYYALILSYTKQKDKHNRDDGGRWNKAQKLYMNF